MTGLEAERVRAQARFRGISPGRVGKGGRHGGGMPCPAESVYGGCGEYVAIAEDKMSSACPDGSQVRKLEEELADFLGLSHAVAVRSGEDALRLALRLAAWKLHGREGSSCWPDCQGTGIRMLDVPGGGILRGQKVLCQDLAAMDLAGAVLAMGGKPVFIDSSETGWAMSSEVLELAFRACPDAKIAIMDHVYGFPGNAPAVRKICDKHNALLVECAGDALGAEYWMPQGDGSGYWARAGSLGDFCVLDFGSERPLEYPGGALLLRDLEEPELARCWAGEARPAVSQKKSGEMGRNVRMDDRNAALLRDRLSRIGEAIEKKKAIYRKYQDKLDGDLASLIPEGEGTRPNYWASCMTSESCIPFQETRSRSGHAYQDIHGTATPIELYDTLHAFGVKCKVVYKPLSMRCAYRDRGFWCFSLDGPWRMRAQESLDGSTAAGFWPDHRAGEYYRRGIVLPSDIGMADDEQDLVIGILYACYDKSDINRLMWTA